MKALLTDHAGRLWQEDIALPEPSEYECLVRMESCAFCHSTDRHIINGTFPDSFHAQSVLGHESVGRVEKTGKRVAHLAPGDRLLRAYAIYPGCTRDDVGSAWGGFAEFGKVTDWRAMIDDGHYTRDNVPHAVGYMQKVPPGIPLEKAMLLTTLKEIFSATAQIEPVEGKQFLVVGAGITACFFGLFLKRRGAARVTMAARRQAPLDFALKQGVADDVRLLADAGRKDTQYNGIVETTGNMEVTELLANMALRTDGTIYSYAVYTGEGQQEFFDRLAAKHAIERVNPAEAAAHAEVTRLVAANEIDAEPFTTACFPFSDWEAAWRTVVDKTSLKTVIRFDG